MSSLPSYPTQRHYTLSSHPSVLHSRILPHYPAHATPLLFTIATSLYHNRRLARTETLHIGFIGDLLIFGRVTILVFRVSPSSDLLRYYIRFFMRCRDGTDPGAATEGITSRGGWMRCALTFRRRVLVITERKKSDESIPRLSTGGPASSRSSETFTFCSNRLYLPFRLV